MNLYALHVMPLLPGHTEELAKDAEMMLEKKICSHIACSMTLVPERAPAADKAAVYRERYLEFTSCFRGDLSKVGILLQATIGHGWIPDEPADFQKIIHAAGHEQYRMCPLDKRFLEYLDDQVGQLAALKPAFFMVDDDFRMETGHTGCMCPLHLEALEAECGRKYTREELTAAMKQDEELAILYAGVCHGSLAGAAKVIRRAIDRSAPGTPCSYCTCMGDMYNTPVISSILAAPGQKNIIRINNARYNCAEMRSFPVRMYQGAAQIAAIAPDTLVLAETDTCPQTRYSTAATLMHAHYTGSILEGCRGAKHWITKMNNFMPEAGVRFREVLEKNSAFYQVLADTLDGAAPEYFAAALLPGSVPAHDIVEKGVLNCCTEENWVNFAANMGLPAHFAPLSAGLPAMITGNDMELLSDAQIAAAVSAGVILDGSAAIKITERGLASLVGIKAVPFSGKQVSGESWRDRIISPANSYAELIPEGGRMESISRLLHRRFQLDNDLKDVGPALLWGHTPSGSRCAVFAAVISAGRDFQRYSWMDLARKEEIAAAMKFVNGSDIAYAEGDDEVYFKSFLLPDGKHLAAIFSLAFDPVRNPVLHLPYKIRKAERLMPWGSWQEISAINGELQDTVEAGSPAIYRFEE